MRSFLSTTVLTILLIGLTFGCSVQKDPDRNTGDDGTRLGAREIPINRTIIDNVSYGDGDMHDWKYFRAPTNGVVTVIFSFDNPNAKGIVIVRDETGMQKSMLEHQGPRLETTFKAEPRNYYLEIFVQTERSDYTLQVDFEQSY